jgi:hypothetical protein
MTIPMGLTRRISPTQLKNYLERQGWEQTAEMRTGATQWVWGVHHTLVPADPAFADYAWMVERVIVALAEAEQRPHEAVVADVVREGSDLLRVAVIGEADEFATTLPLLAGRLLLETLDGLVTSASSDAALRAGLSSIAVAHVQRTYRNQVALGQTQVGSYVVPLTLPAQWPELPRLVSKASLPTGRAVALALAGKLRQLSDPKSEEDSLVQMDSASLQSLLELLSSGTVSAVDFEFEWSALAGPVPSEFATPSRLTEGSISALEAMLQEFGAYEERLRLLSPRIPTPSVERVETPQAVEPVELIGRVTTLTRSRRATIVAEVLEKQRSIHVWLSPTEYREAGQALVEQLPIVLEGNLLLRPRAIARIIELRRFEVVRDAA